MMLVLALEGAAAGWFVGAATGGVVASGAAAQPNPVLKTGVVAVVSEHVELKSANDVQPLLQPSVHMSAVVAPRSHERVA